VRQYGFSTGLGLSAVSSLVVVIERGSDSDERTI